MSAWLDPVRAALARDSSRVTIFFRDDDAGWDDEGLYRLLDVVTRFGMPIALAAIPMAIGSALAAELRSLLNTRAPVVSVHQHGYAHVNHEMVGRKSEFGASRRREVQRRDLADGRRRLEDSIGGALPPIFTPPWNRCTRDTAECLTELGVQVLSRDASAERFDLPSLEELPVSFDWTRGRRSGSIAWGERIAGAIESGQPIGVMLHHAVMRDDDRRMLSDLLEVLAERSRAGVRPMVDIAASRRPGGLS